MSVSYQNRGLSELHSTSTRNFGVQAAALPAIQQLNLNHNSLRSLECPFAGAHLTSTELQGSSGFARHPAPLLPLRPDTSILAEAQSRLLNTSSHSAAATAAASEAGVAERGSTVKLLSLEEENSGLRGLTSLAQLFVSYNQLRSLRGLCGAAQTLTTLVATHNQLTSLDGMQACRQLRYIDVSHNAIDSLKGLPLTCAVDSDGTRGVHGAAGGGEQDDAEGEGAAARAAQSASLLSAATSSLQVRTPPPAAASELPVAAAGATVNVHDSALAFSFMEENATDDTSSVAFSAHTSPGETARLHLHGTPSAAAAAARRSASTNTSVRYQIDETPLASVGTPAALALDGGGQNAAAPAGEAHRTRTPLEESDLPDQEVVLILSHNRLRGRALAALLWVGGGDESDDMTTQQWEGGANASQNNINIRNNSTITTRQRRNGGAAHLLRPWSTALTRLDLSHNFIEDISDVRRLFAYVPAAPPHTVEGTSDFLRVPALPRLRHLDLSANPCLANGSLAQNLHAAATTYPMPSQKPAGQHPHSTARRSTAKPCDVAVLHSTHAVPPIAFQLRYASHALADALRSAANTAAYERQVSAVSAPTTNAFASLAAAQPAMEAVLHSLAEDWRAAPLLRFTPHHPNSVDVSSLSAKEEHPATATLLALFSAAERQRYLRAATKSAAAAAAATAKEENNDDAAPASHLPSVLLHGAEVTVLAAALQQQGAQLGAVVRVAHPDPVNKSAQLLSPSSIAAAMARRSPAGRRAASTTRGGARAAAAADLSAQLDTSTVNAFLTPPPKWGRETSSSTTFVQTSLLSSSSPLPHESSIQRQQQQHKGTAVTTPRGLHLERASTTPVDSCTRHSDVASTTETSTVGYRLYPGRHPPSYPRHHLATNDALAAPVEEAESKVEMRLFDASSERRAQDSASQAGNDAVVTPVRAPLAASPIRPSSTHAQEAAATPTKAAAAAATASPPPLQPARVATSDDAVALQLYRGEVAVLRRRLRELQRQSTDQACVVQRHEAAMRAATAAAATAEAERRTAQAELVAAKAEIQRLQAQVRSLMGEQK